ncbi:MAG: UDP-N-acetylmuramate--L-alanine ligase [Cyclobacteriaceae bacterium]
MRLGDIHIVHFLGIGGIGMSALARWFHHTGKQVSGYDLTPSPLTKELEALGIEISYQDKVADIPKSVIDARDGGLVVYTPAIPQNHQQYNYFVDQGYQLLKRSQVLGIITKSLSSIAVAGTHGKTTTSSMVAHLLKHADHPVNAFVGGIMTNYNSNLIVGDQDSWAVVEADEYDRSFLQLSPEMAIVTAIDADHLDIYGDHSAMQDSFNAFIAKIAKGGHLFVHEGVAPELDLPEYVTTTTYGLDAGHIHATNVKISDGLFQFDVSGKIDIKGVQLSLPGFHNVENALAAIGVVSELGYDAETIKAGIAAYRGVKRRFEYILRDGELVFIDDYAHHPSEIASLIKSVRALYPEKKITTIFQPHLYSRTRDFMDGFAQELSKSDEVVLLDIYPAREQPIPGVDATLLLDKLTTNYKQLVSKSDLVDWVGANDIEVLLTVGAGDIDRLVAPIAEQLKGRRHHVEG